MPYAEDMHVEPLRPLLPGGLMEASGVTLISGKQGEGKSLVGAYQTRALAYEGFTVAILDFEQQESEWIERLGQLPLKTVSYHPIETDILSASSLIEDEIFAAYNPTVCILDSASMLRPEVKGITDAGAVRKVFQVVNRWRRPILILTHVAKDEAGKPDATAIGSVMWMAYPRLAWTLVQERSDPIETVVRLHCTKVNRRSKLDTVELAWDWRDGEVRRRVLADAPTRNGKPVAVVAKS